MRHYHRIKSIYPGFANIELTLLNLADLIIVIFFTTATIKLRDVVISDLSLNGASKVSISLGCPY